MTIPPPSHLPASSPTGKVYLVGAGPGAADLITLRGHRLLAQATAVVYDSLVAPELYAGLTAALFDAGKRSGNHGLGQEGIHALLIDLARRGHTVVRLKGGDPYVLGRGSEEAIALGEQGIACEVVPGVSSSLAAPLLSGIPLTHRGLADSFCVVSAHPQHAGQVPAMPPWEPRRTLVVLMGVQTAPAWLAQLLDLGWPGDLPVAFVHAASWVDAAVWTTTLGEAIGDIERRGLHSPAVAVLGHVVDLRATIAGVP